MLVSRCARSGSRVVKLMSFSRDAVDTVVIGSLICAMLCPLMYILYTGQIWEDYLITARHSINLCEGKGLTYEVGTRVQGFTSPTGALIIAGLYQLAGTEPLARWAYRALSTLAFATGLWVTLTALKRGPKTRAVGPILFTAAMWALESKAVAFTVNGMETAFVMLAAAGVLWFLATPTVDRPARLGAVWAFFMWTRPDACVYIALMAGAMLTFAGSKLTRCAAGLSKAAAVCTAAYFPWFAFAWWYYGSPIPQTIHAKSLEGSLLSPSGMQEVFHRLPDVLGAIYLPAYSQFGGWQPFEPLAVALGAAAVLYWLVPGGSLLARRASLVAFGGFLYLLSMPLAYPWYFPTVLVFTLPALSEGLMRVADWSRRRSNVLHKALLAVACAIPAVNVVMTVDSAHRAEVNQRINDWGNRRLIGLWLREHGADHETVFAECLGYFGFFSQMNVLDYPGLVAPKVVRVRQRVGDSMPRVGMELKTDWMVLRLSEAMRFERESSGWLDENYALMKTFDTRPLLLAELPKHKINFNDSVFLVFQRRR